MSGGVSPAEHEKPKTQRQVFFFFVLCFSGEGESRVGKGKREIQQTYKSENLTQYRMYSYWILKNYLVNWKFFKAVKWVIFLFVVAKSSPPHALPFSPSPFAATYQVKAKNREREREEKE